MLNFKVEIKYQVSDNEEKPSIYFCVYDDMARKYGVF